ncbi:MULTISPECIES: hypothetical protein [Bacillus]|uniref:hypothetical protein n=1 Tax=Bacillus TaxID=1386 RepID=UPI000B8C28FE|nr:MULTISPECIES: hypothetical protein [Bacillus]OXS81444.1 hypothetical protein B1726_17100 [Bacillus sp. LYLB4]
MTIHVLHQLESFLKWFIDNSGSFGVFILTIFTVIIAKRSLAADLKSIKIAEEELLSNQSPDVIAYLEVKKFKIHFIVKNFGSAPACDVTFEFEEVSGKFEFRDFNKDTRIIKDGIATLAPNQTIDVRAGTFDEIRTNDEYPIVDVIIRYKNKEGREFKDIYRHNLNIYKKLPVSANKDMYDIVQELERTNRLLKKFLK